MLIEFDRVCKELGLRYTLSFGTMLGAVRHGGFIPWDDDVDVAMPREDYERFIKEAPKVLDNEKYTVEHFSTDPNVRQIFAKLRNNKTTFCQLETLGTKVNQRMWLDIFPVDRVPNNEKYHQKLIKKHALYWRLQWYDSKQYRKTMDSKLKRILAWCMGWISKMCGGHHALLIKEEKMNMKYLGDLSATYTVGGDDLNKAWMPYDFFENYTKIKFEGYEFSVVANYDEYLRELYGDYMVLPPEDQRQTHIASLVDCDTPYTEYIDDKGNLKEGVVVDKVK